MGYLLAGNTLLFRTMSACQEIAVSEGILEHDQKPDPLMRLDNDTQ
jgi:hypothetical protein